MDTSLLLAEVKSLGALAKGHFVFTHGQHSADDFNKAIICADPHLIFRICQAMASAALSSGVETVAALATGAIVPGQHTALHLSNRLGHKVNFVWADKDESGGFAFNREFGQFVRGKKVLLVEDVLTTGGSARKMAELILATGGELCGVSALCNRNEVRPEQICNTPFLESVFNLQLPSWPAEECHLCKEGVPINIEIGHGADFVAEHGQPQQ